MDKITYFKATSLRMAGFKHHDQPVEYQFGDITVISGGNRVGKTTVADAIAFAITGKGYMGDRFINRFYHKDGREIRLSLSYLDQTGTEHTIERRRKDDKMEIALDGRSILQRDLVSMFGDLDEFLALYNPLYFIEILQDGGRKLLEKHLPPMPQESILAQMSETMCTALAGYTFISPEAALVNLRAEKKEIEEALLAYSGRKEMAAEVAIRQADAKNLLSAKIADLQKRADQWEARRTEGLDMKALNLELIEMSDRHNELLQEKPKPFDPAPYRERQAKLREKIEVRRQEIYESKLTEQFAKLPGIGGKTAQRLAFYLLSQPQEEAEEFADALLEARRSVHLCPVCQNLTDRDICPICEDEERDHGLVCVVAEPKDVVAMERAREYHGVYHVLHGVISPLNQVGPDDLRIRELLERVGKGGVREVIMATNPDTEGEATAMYLSRLLRPLEVRVTRLAYGIPVGSQLEYADEVTLLRALEGRRAI